MSNPEPRIYIVVADRVTVPEGEIKQPLGRQVAQACHAVSMIRTRMVLHQVAAKGKKQGPISADGAITTIVLAARDSREMEHITQLLENEDVNHLAFYDTNDSAYGKDVEVKTALALFPTQPETVAGILDYLPLWGSSHHLRE